MTTRRTKQPTNNDQSANESSMIMSKFNTVYRHSVLDILTHYADIPTDPNPDNNPLSTKNPTDPLNSEISYVTQSLLNHKNPISNIKIKSIDFKEIAISFNHPLAEMEIIKPIPFSTPATSWKDVELKIIMMSKESALARDLSNLRVSGISYPTSAFNLILIMIVFLLPFGYFYPNLLYDSFFANYLPWMLTLKSYHNYIFYATLLIHTIEFYILLIPRIKLYRVPLDYAIEWAFLTLLDGYQSIKRFDKYVLTISPDDVYYDFTNTEYFL